jgi:hypothetical protein
MEILLTTIIFAISCGLFVSFIDFCFNEGNILDFYYIFIQNKFYETNSKLFKVLGGCSKCFGFWINIFLFFYFFGFNIFLLIPFIGISQLTITIYSYFFG